MSEKHSHQVQQLHRKTLIPKWPIWCPLSGEFSFKTCHNRHCVQRGIPTELNGLGEGLRTWCSSRRTEEMTNIKVGWMSVCKAWPSLKHDATLLAQKAIIILIIFIRIWPENADCAHSCIDIKPQWGCTPLRQDFSGANKSPLNRHSTHVGMLRLFWHKIARRDPTSSKWTQNGRTPIWLKLTPCRLAQRTLRGSSARSENAAVIERVPPATQNGCLLPSG